MASPDDGLPPTLAVETRSWISLLLFVHLFMIVVALAAYPSSSGMERRLKELFSPYLQTLNFDLNHSAYPTSRYYLTHGLPTDVDFAIELDEKLAGGQERKTVIPPEGLWPTARLRRYQALANAAGSLIGNDPVESNILQGIAAGALAESGSKRGVIRVRAHYLPSVDSFESSKPEERDPNSSMYVRNVYEANVLNIGGVTQLSKISAAGEVAPVDTKAGADQPATTK